MEADSREFGVKGIDKVKPIPLHHQSIQWKGLRVPRLDYKPVQFVVEAGSQKRYMSRLPPVVRGLETPSDKKSPFHQIQQLLTGKVHLQVLHTRDVDMA